MRGACIDSAATFWRQNASPFGTTITTVRILCSATASYCGWHLGAAPARLDSTRLDSTRFDTIRPDLIWFGSIPSVNAPGEG